VSEPQDSDGPPSIRLILDASAICAFGGNETVGEIIGDIQEEDEGFAVPTACLAEAIALGAEPGLVRLLQANLGCVVLHSTADWETLGRFLDLTRPSSTAVHNVADADVTMLAVRTGAFVLTDQPMRYVNIYSGVGTLLLEKPWT
jgi:hypothetical protein